MIFDYTEAELEQFSQLDNSYSQLLDQIDRELRKHNKNTAVYAKLLEERDELESQRMADVAAIYEKAERARFDALGGDTTAVLNEAIRQVDLIIKCRIENDIVSDSRFTNAMKRILDEELNFDDAHELLNKVDMITRYEKEHKPTLSSRDARKLIYDGLTLFVDYLNDHEDELKALNKYISEYISTSPYIYVYAGKPDIKPEIITNDIRKPLALIETYGLMNDKSTNQLVSNDVYIYEDNGKVKVALNTNQAARGKKDVIVNTALTFEGTQAQLTKRMTEYDRAVYNAISTAYYYHKRNHTGGPFYITPLEIWRIMTGTQDTSRHPSAAQIQRVCDSVNKMRFTRLYMNITSEIEAFNLTFDDERITKGVIDTYLLKADSVSFTTEKGKEVIGYRIDAEPILYTYNNTKNHMIFVQFDLLDTTKTTGNEGSTIEIRSYLLRQIELMYNRKRDSNRILYDKLYYDTSLDTPEARTNRDAYTNENTYKTRIKQEAKKDREKIAAILEAWKEKGYIKDYIAVKSGSKFTGVDIVLQSEK